MTNTATPTAAAALPPIQAFKAGRHVDAAGHVHDWTAADLQELADSYDPALREAPICIGHPKGNAPAFGWVGKVQTDGRVLEAVPSQVQPEFQDWVKRGLFKKVSLSIYGRTHPNNPRPGKLYMRHVGFLGAQPPAVAGLADYAFADGDDSAELHEFGGWTDSAVAALFRGMRDWLIGKFGQEEADRALPGYSVQGLADEAVREQQEHTSSATQASGLNYSEGNPPMPGNTTAANAADLAAQAAELQAREAALQAGEAALAERTRQAAHAARMAQFSEFADGLVRSGQLLPAHRASILGVLGALPDATVLEFGEGDALVKQTPAEALQAFLKTLPKVVDFSERAGAGGAATTAGVDLTDGQAIAKAALEFQEAEAKAGRTVSLESAVQHIVNEHQEG